MSRIRSLTIASLLFFLLSNTVWAQQEAREIHELLSETAPVISKPDFPKSPLSIRDHHIAWKGQSIEYLLVGSGPAGSVLAHQLSEAGFRTVLVESGSFVLPGVVDTREIPALKVGGGSVPTEDSRILVRNANVVGGGSTVNVDLAFAPTLPMVEAKFSQWRSQGSIGKDQWTPNDMARSYAWVVEQLGTRTPSPTEINANNQVLWDGARAVGLSPKLYDLNSTEDLDLASNKLSATKKILIQALTRPKNPLYLIPDMRVKRLLDRDGRINSVQMTAQDSWDNPTVIQDPSGLKPKSGQTYTISADRVILCAGAQGSAELLLRSKLGGPEVGKGVILHPSMPVIGSFDRKIDALKGTASTVYVAGPEGLLFECMTGSREYVEMMLFGSGDEISQRLERFDHLAGFGVLLVDRASDQNRVELDQQGAAEVFYQLTEPEQERMRGGIRKAVIMMLRAGAKEVYLPTVELDEQPGHLQVYREEEDLEVLSRLRFLPGQTVLTSAHMQSTCKMGKVVNQKHQVRGLSNLYICDSSIFPSSVGANPMQSVYTIAKLFSEQLIAEKK